MPEILMRRALESIRHLQDPDPPWHEILRTASALMGTDGAVFIVQRLGRVDIQQVGADPAAVSDYARYFHAQDVLLRPGMAMPVGSWLDTHAILTARDRERSSYYNDFMCRHRMRQLGSVILSRESRENWSSLGVQREQVDAKLGQRMTGGTMSRYLLSLNAAVKSRSAAAAQWLLTTQIMFEGMDEVVLLVSPAGTVVQASAATRARLQEAGLLRLDALWHPSESIRMALHSSLARTNNERAAHIAQHVPSSDGELLRFSFVKAASTLRLLNEDLVFVRVCFPRASSGADLEVLRASFSITAAEASVLLALAGGEVAKAYATRKAVSIHTVRKQIATLMQKMNCVRQLQLVQKATAALGR